MWSYSHLHLEVKNLLGCFKKIQFHKRAKRASPNSAKADALVNKTLDEAAKRGTQNRRSSRTKLPLVREGIFLHVSIRTSNMNRSIEFYSKFFGLKVKRRAELQTDKAKIVFLQDAEGKGSTLELTFYPTQTKFEQPEFENRLFDHLGFEVQDIHKTISAMKKEKVTVTDEPYQFKQHTTIAFVEDPDGTRIELIERH